MQLNFLNKTKNHMNNNNNSAKFAFFYMLSLVALIFTALSTGMIIFQIINKNISDIINQYKGVYSSDQLKFAISALIISAPIFYFTMRQIYKNLFSGNLKKDSGIRKWLTYFVLFVSSVVMIGWLIGTVNTFLDGDLTIKFILKSMSAILISASIFTFYFYDIKRENVVGVKNRIIQIYFYASLVIVLAVFIASLFFVESPQETRNRKIDEAILGNFYKIENEINLYYSDFKKLPDNLEEVKSEYNNLAEQDLIDPETGINIEYKKAENNAYELCANFRISNKDKNNEEYQYVNGNKLHDAGYQCLKYRATTDKDNRGLEPIL